MTRHKKIESNLFELLFMLKDTCTASESVEVRDFIDVGEYGVALETLICIIKEESKKISKEVLILIKETAVYMAMDPDLVNSKLINNLR